MLRRVFSWRAAACLLVAGVSGSATAEDFTIHGYLTQAYADSSDLQIFGVPTDGTYAYRTLALQFRYQIAEADALVVQLSHDETGESPLEQFRDEVELDWAFYERQIFDSGSVRVGRVPVPFGIYNELRDVGTILEFYRPPASIYFEGAFSSETVDGIVLGHRFENAWPISIDVYGGEWERIDAAGPTFPIAEARAEDAFGAQLWVETPLEGLRLGVAAQRFDFVGGLTTLRRDPDGDLYEVVLASLDLTRERFYVRGEYQVIDAALSITPDLEYTAWYLQAGVRWDAWGLHVISEQSALEGSGSGPGETFQTDPFYDDLAFGVTYSFSPSIVLKAEYHDIGSQILAEELGPPDETRETDLWIASLSVSF